MKTKETTRVSDRVPDPGGLASSEALLDDAVEQTFPASDPISVTDAFRAAREREERRATAR